MNASGDTQKFNKEQQDAIYAIALKSDEQVRQKINDCN